jgi:hypothetical protein
MGIIAEIYANKDATSDENDIVPGADDLQVALASALNLRRREFPDS